MSRGQGRDTQLSPSLRNPYRSLQGMFLAFTFIVPFSHLSDAFIQSNSVVFFPGFINNYLVNIRDALG